MLKLLCYIGICFSGTNKLLSLAFFVLRLVRPIIRKSVTQIINNNKQCRPGARTQRDGAGNNYFEYQISVRQLL